MLQLAAVQWLGRRSTKRGQEEVFGGREEVSQDFSENLEVIIRVDDLDIMIHRAIHRGQAAISCLSYYSTNYNISHVNRCQAL